MCKDHFCCSSIWFLLFYTILFDRQALEPHAEITIEFLLFWSIFLQLGLFLQLKEDIWVSVISTQPSTINWRNASNSFLGIQKQSLLLWKMHSPWMRVEMCMSVGLEKLDDWQREEGETVQVGPQSLTQTTKAGHWTISSSSKALQSTTYCFYLGQS